MFWNGGLVYSDVAFIRKHNACGGLRPSFKYKSEEDWGKLIVKGWHADTVATVGPVFDEETPFGQTQNKSKELAGAPWTHGAVEKEIAFNRTVTGDACQEDLPSDWPYLPYLTDRQKESAVHLPDPSESLGRTAGMTNPSHIWNPAQIGETLETQRQIRQLWRLIAVCCLRSRFIVTESRRFGLGPSDMKPRDRVYILLGSDVPIVLGRLLKNEFFFRGQAYVDGIMNYQGDISEDIKQGKIKLQKYTLC